MARRNESPEKQRLARLRQFLDQGGEVSEDLLKDVKAGREFFTTTDPESGRDVFLPAAVRSTEVTKFPSNLDPIQREVRKRDLAARKERVEELVTRVDDILKSDLTMSRDTAVQQAKNELIEADKQSSEQFNKDKRKQELRKEKGFFRGGIDFLSEIISDPERFKAKDRKVEEVEVQSEDIEKEVSTPLLNPDAEVITNITTDVVSSDVKEMRSSGLFSEEEIELFTKKKLRSIAINEISAQGITPTEADIKAAIEMLRGDI